MATGGSTWWLEKTEYYTHLSYGVWVNLTSVHENIMACVPFELISKLMRHKKAVRNGLPSLPREKHAWPAWLFSMIKWLSMWMSKEQQTKPVLTSVRLLILAPSTSFRSWGTHGQDELGLVLGGLKLSGLPGLDKHLMSSNEWINTVHQG